MSEYVVRALSPDTWDGFAGLTRRHNGVFGGCWCTYFHRHSEKTFDADDNRSLKRRLVEEGRAHAASSTTGTRRSRGASTGAPRSCRTSTTASSTRRSSTSSPTTGSPSSSWTGATGERAVGRRAAGCPRPDLGGGRWRRRGLPARHAGQEEVRALQRDAHPLRAGGLHCPQQGHWELRRAPHRALTHRGHRWAIPRTRRASERRLRWPSTNSRRTPGGRRARERLSPDGAHFQRNGPRLFLNDYGVRACEACGAEIARPPDQ